jgi:ketosteroid isomerase-like protein
VSRHPLRNDWEAALQYVDPDVESRTNTPLVDLPQVSRGHATGHAGIEVDQRVAFRFLIRDERVIRFISYWERAAAFEALGLPARG